MPQPEHSRSSRIEFVPFEVETALPDLRRWLVDPDVRRWYDEGEPTTANLRRRFAPDPGVRACSILIDRCPAGYIQVYWLRDHPEYQRQVDVDPEAVSIDLFIGEPDLRGQRRRNASESDESSWGEVSHGDRLRSAGTPGALPCDKALRHGSGCWLAGSTRHPRSRSVRMSP